MAKELGKVVIESAAELREWLSKNHSSSGSVWLVTWKKDSGQSSRPGRTDGARGTGRPSSSKPRRMALGISSMM